MAATVHKKACDVTGDWIGRRVTVPMVGGTLTAVLSDFEVLVVEPIVVLYMAGRCLAAPRHTTVTLDELGLLGGAA